MKMAQKERKIKLSFTTKKWGGSLRNFGKDIEYTVDVRIGGKRQTIIFIPKDGSKPKTMEYSQEGYPPGIIGGEVMDDF